MGYHQDHYGDATYDSGSSSAREEVAGRNERVYDSGIERRDRFEMRDSDQFRGRVSAPADSSGIGSRQDQPMIRDEAAEASESRVAERSTTDERENATQRDGNAASDQANDGAAAQPQQETQAPPTQSSEAGNPNENENQPNSETQQQ